MSNTPQKDTSPEAKASKAVMSNPGKKAPKPDTGSGPKITKLPGGTIKEDY